MALGRTNSEELGLGIGRGIRAQDHFTKNIAGGVGCVVVRGGGF